MNYCIRPDYVSRKQALTFVETPSQYWNRKRIRSSGFYQYYVYKEAAKIVESMAECSFVDVGCGYPRKIAELIQPVTDRITLVDQPSLQSLFEKEFPEMAFIPMDLEGPTRLQNKFDCVVCSDVIEHLLDPDPLMEFLAGILNPRGRLILSTPERDVERGRHCRRSPKREHVREWNSAEFCAYLDHSGLDVMEHALLPKGKLFRFEESSWALFSNLKIRRYSGCQMAVCQLKSEPVG